MAYEIRDLAYHKAALAAPVKNRDHLDVEDCALSSWGDTQMLSYHRKAIELLENGEELGVDGPAAMKKVLWDKAEDREVDAWIIRSKFGPCWMLGDDEEAKHGRKFMPTGSRSRVHKKHNLEERDVMTPCKRWLGTACAGLGCPVSFFPEFE